MTQEGGGGGETGELSRGVERGEGSITKNLEFFKNGKVAEILNKIA